MATASLLKLEEEKQRGVHRVWTIQPLEVWEIVQAKGMYLCDGRKTMPFSFDKQMCYAYRWMKDQMRKRLKDYNGRFPVWAWYEKPDLRQERHLWPIGTKCVRIELEVKSERILFSDIGIWGFALIGHPCTSSEKEWDDWAAGCNWTELNKKIPSADMSGLPDSLRQEIEESWEKIFDLQHIGSQFDHNWVDSSSIQGVVDAIRIEEVKAVSFFTGTMEKPY